MLEALKRSIFFILFEILFCSILAICLIFYGPFTNIKETLITSAMTTMNHRYIASWFLSAEEINKIMQKNSVKPTSQDEQLDHIVVNENRSDNIELLNIETNKFKGYLLIVEDPEKVKVGTAQNLGVGGMPLSQIVKKYNGLGGINAGGFSDDKMEGTGGIPTGIVIENSKIKYKSDASDTYSVIGLNTENILVIGNYTLEEILQMKIRDAISFGPPLVLNGDPLITEGNGGWGIAPRAAIGQRRDGAILLLTIDGRQKDTLGATLKDVQDVLLKYDAYNAANLDGGSSTTMYYRERLINSPSNILGERAIPSAFIIK